MKQTILKFVLSGVLLAGFAGIASAQTTREFLDKKGRVRYTISYYGEKGLPAAVRSIVKPVYYDYAILTVEEVRGGGRDVYYIDIQDDAMFKTIRVEDGEMEVVTDMRRADLPLQSQHGL